MRELICGKNSVIDAIDNKLPLKTIYTTRASMLKGVKNVKEVDRDFLDKLTRENHQGFVAELESFNYFSLEDIINDKPEKVLILDHIQDPRNFGAIIRSANAFGIKHIIIPKDRAAKVTASVIKVSSGGYVGIKIILVNSLIDVITKLKKSAFWIYATGFDNSVDINKATFNYPMAIILGNEEKGVSNTLLKHSDEIVRIETTGTVQSLNVSVSAGIILSKI